MLNIQHNAPGPVPSQLSFDFPVDTTTKCASAQCEGGQIIIVTSDGVCYNCAVRESKL